MPINNPHKAQTNQRQVGTSMRGILCSGGVISQSFDGFESRPEQIKMAHAVQKAFADGRDLVVEAGTGVGKSFAYLIPAIKKSVESGDKVLISTFTITLQEQLINKDLPFLAECLGAGFVAILAKGRGNYLCKRRLRFAMRRQSLLFEKLAEELVEISDWAGETEDGSLSDLPFVPSGKVWDLVNSEHGNCPGRRCDNFADCFYRRARRRLEGANIIVSNHALMFSDLVLKEESFSLLPDYKSVVIDEAHNIENVAQEHFGIDISSGKIKYLLDGLYNNNTHKGLLVYSKNADKAIKLVWQIRKCSSSFFRNVKDWYELNRKENGGRCHKNFVEDNLSERLKQLRAELSAMANNIKDVDEKLEILRFANRSAAVVKDLHNFLCQEKDGYVYWVEVGAKSRSAVRLKSAPLNVGADVKRALFDEYESVVLTSATLSTDGEQEGGFDFFARRIGLVDYDGVKLGSPYDYEKQVTIYIEKDMPDPNEGEFIECATEAIKKYVQMTKGSAFVLFTSYMMLEKIAEKITGWFDEQGMKLLQQGAGVDRSGLLKRFKNEQGCVLFGTDSFWQGVDVPGESLSNVIIVRLPFAVPNQPLLAGRIEQIRKQGGNPFLDYQLPSAIIKFKQGFGRLIRSKSDRGIVVVLDSRIVQKSYGRRFLAAIPKCNVQIV